MATQLNDETLDALTAMRGYRDSRAFFNAARRAASRIGGIERELAEGPDAMPHGSDNVRGGGIGNPTESRALWLVTEGAAWERRLKDELAQCVYLVGCALVLIEFVRNNLGEVYAELLDAKYIDDGSWEDAAERVEYSVVHAKRLGYVALDWLDMEGDR